MKLKVFLRCWVFSLALGVGLVSSSEAAITYFDLDPDVNFTGFTVNDYDPLTGVARTGIEFGIRANIVIELADRNIEALNGWEVLETASGFVQPLAFDDTIDGTDTIWTTGLASLNTGGDGHDIGTTVYYGIRYDDGGSYGYGWLHVRRDGDRDFTLLASGYNSSGEILAGQTSLLSEGGGSAVPEPGTMALMTLGLGAASLARRRLQESPLPA